MSAIGPYGVDDCSGVGFGCAVLVLAAALRRGLVSASGPFELVIGPKGSATQLVMSSVLLQDVPIGNMPTAAYETLTRDPRVRDAVPLALGDNVQGVRVVGIGPRFFEVAAPGQPPFYAIADGQVFTQDFEAVLGAAAAQHLKLGVGNEFVTAHGVLGGVNEAEHGGKPYRVVGILAPTHTPADLAIYVSMRSYLAVHNIADVPAFGKLGQHDDDKTVTAVFVRARDVSSAYQLYQQINSDDKLQAALPGAVLTQFLEWLGQGQQVLAWLSNVALGMAAITVALSLYGSARARRRDVAIVRALGWRRTDVLLLALLEAITITALGVVSGLVLGYLGAGLLSSWVAAQSAVAANIHIEPAAGWVALGMLGAGLLAGLVPALMAYRLVPTAVLSSAI